MNRTTVLVVYLLAGTVLPELWSTAPAKEPNPPAGFRAIFNGKDLTGWYGLNPHSAAQLKGEKKEANLKQQRSDFPKHWGIENGELVNDGTGPYATTEAEFGDIEFRLEYKTVAKADSGIYLRGTPQVQIWDWNQIYNPRTPIANRTLAPVDFSTIPRVRQAATRMSSRTSPSVSGTSSASNKSGRRRGYG